MNATCFHSYLRLYANLGADETESVVRDHCISFEVQNSHGYVTMRPDAFLPAHRQGTSAQYSSRNQSGIPLSLAIVNGYGHKNGEYETRAI